MTFPTPRPKARPGKSAGIPKPNLAPRASGITIESREQSAASLAKTQRIKGAKA